jgi:acyl-CoA hydrolase
VPDGNNSAILFRKGWYCLSWRSDYQRKLTNLSEVSLLVQSGYRIYLGAVAATPVSLVKELIANTSVNNVEVIHLLGMMGRDPFADPKVAGRFRHNSLFVGPTVRDSVNAGEADYVPIFLHQVSKLFTSKILPLNMAIMQVSPPDEHGYMSMGVTVMASRAAAEAADVVVVQVNKNMPRVLGDSFIHVSEVDYIVELHDDLPELMPTAPSELETQIAEHVAELIPDGATLQLGIGGIPDAILRCLQGKKDLGIHTEMVSDGVMNAMEAGLITCARKTLHPGKVVATFVLGSRQLYDYVDNNPAFEFHQAHYTNDPFVIAQNDNLVAINSAVEVDLTGQVCADTIGASIFSGFGGQVDFIRGASRSRGGKAVIALPSTARGGKISRICGFLQEGTLRHATQIFNGNIYDLVCYSMTREEWENFGYK